MPRVPEYNAQTPRAAPMPQVRPMPVPDADALGAPVTQAIGNLAQSIAGGAYKIAEAHQDVAREEKRKADEFRTMQLDAQFGERINKRLYDSNEGFLFRKGENAIDADPVNKALDKDLQNILGQAANDEQRKAVLLRAQHRLLSAHEVIQKHSGSEIREVFTQAADGQVDLSLKNINNNPDDPKAVQSEIDLMTGPVVLNLKNNLGLPPEKIEAVRRGLEAKAHETAIRALMARGDGAAASARFNEVKSKLGPESAQLEQQVQATYRAQEGERKARELVEAARNPATKWIDSDAASKAVDKLPPGPLRDEVHDRVQQKIQEGLKIKNEAIDNVFNRSLTAYQQRRSLPDVTPADKVWLKQNDPLSWEKLKNIAKGDAEYARTLQATPEQQRNMTAFVLDVADHPDKYATMPLPVFNRMVLPTLAPPDQQHAGRILAEMHEQANKPQPLGNAENMMLIQKGREAGVFPPKGRDVSTWDDEQAQVYYAAQQRITELSANYKRQNGKPASIEQLEKWSHELFTQGTVPGSGLFGSSLFKTKTTRIQSEIKGTGLEVKDISAVPESERAVITKELKDRNRPIDDATILDWYNKANSRRARREKLPESL